MRLALIANHQSGRGDDPQALTRELLAAGRAGAPPLAVEPFRIDALAGVAEAAARQPFDRLVVAGGDGSIAPVAALAADLDVELALLPVGTANDFARAMRIPRNLPAALRLAADPGARSEPCELGRIDRRRPFVNVASLGLASVAARRAKPLKSRLGPLAYAVGAVHAGATARPLDLRATAEIGRAHV
jgi:diacylglycerol kinase (ATP)